MLCHRLDYPTPEEEKEVLRRNMALGIRREDTRGRRSDRVRRHRRRARSGRSTNWSGAMEAVQHVHVSETFIDHVVEVVDRTRPSSRPGTGCSPRAGIALVKAARARALIHGRNYVIPEDLFALAEDVILHRIRLTYEALAEGRHGPERPRRDPRAVRRNGSQRACRAAI